MRRSFNRKTCMGCAAEKTTSLSKKDLAATIFRCLQSPSTTTRLTIKDQLTKGTRSFPTRNYFRYHSFGILTRTPFFLSQMSLSTRPSQGPSLTKAAKLISGQQRSGLRRCLQKVSKSKYSKRQEKKVKRQSLIVKWDKTSDRSHPLNERPI